MDTSCAPPLPLKYSLLLLCSTFLLFRLKLLCSLEPAYLDRRVCLRRGSLFPTTKLGCRGILCVRYEVLSREQKKKKKKRKTLLIYFYFPAFFFFLFWSCYDLLFFFIISLSCFFCFFPEKNKKK